MRTKNLVIIFILFLLIILGGSLAVIFTGEKGQAILNESGGIVNSVDQSAAEEKPDAAVQAKANVQPEKAVPAEIIDKPAEEKNQAIMLIDGVEYRTAIKPASSVYDLMNMLKTEKKIDFKSKDYSSLGFFIEEINGVKNNPAGKNWVYYVNGQPAPVGVSYYLIKANDMIEWKYEKKSF